MPIMSVRLLDQIEQAVAALRERNDGEPALHCLRQAISSSRFLSSIEVPWNTLTGSTRTLSNQVVIDANIISVLEALADPALRLRVVRSKRGRPRTKALDEEIKKSKALIKDLNIYLAVSARILERLGNARPNQTRGSRSIIGIKTIRDEVAKEFNLPESAIRKAYARIERRAEKRERFEALTNPANTLMTLRWH